MWVPYHEALLSLLPEEAIIRPVDDIQRAALATLQTRSLMTPSQALVSLAKDYYYRTILSGGNPQTLKFDLGSMTLSTSESTEFLDTKLSWFMNHWRSPGFKFRDKEPYFVRSEYLDSRNYLNLGWFFRASDAPLTVRNEYETWMSEQISDTDRNMEDLTRFLLDPSLSDGISPRVYEQLPRYMESDTFILHLVNRFFVDQRDIVLVSGDRKLAAQIRRIASADVEDVRVWVMDPKIYEFGRSDEIENGLPFRFPGLDNCLVLKDPGSILFSTTTVDVTDAEGISTDDGVVYFLQPIITSSTRFPGVFDIKFDWTRKVNTSSMGW
jgi:hypothetical protein